MRKLLIIISFLITGQTFIYGQLLNSAQVHGNFYVKAQTYKEDSTIGAEKVDDISRMNAYGNINYSVGKFTAGLRYEAYYNALLGYDENYNGSGVPYKYATYTDNNFEITIGNYYEQFGYGLIFRTFDDPSLGYDNCMDGVKLKFNPFEGVYLKGIYGKQRYYFELGDGIVRGVDGEIMLNQAIKKLSSLKTQINIGGSFVSKYQKDKDPRFILPENVSAFSGRINIFRGNVSLDGEYAYKINDPSSDNGLIYKPGQAVYLISTYSQRGFSVMLSAKRVDNMSFRSDRNALINNLNINYIPTTTKNHAYSLASMYPYATQPNGEVELQGEVQYKLKKGTFLGGKYGTFVSANYALVRSINREPVNINGKDTLNQPGTDGYTSDFFTIGDDTYFQDFNIEIKRKFSKKVKGTLKYLNIIYDKGVIEKPGYGKIYSDIIVSDVTYKFKKKQAIRFELQHLSTEQDHGNWVSSLVEYTFPHWFVTIYNDYNYGNKEKKVHYPTLALAYTKKASRLELSYGRQRKGIVCVGGICRELPASHGFAITFTTSF